MDEHSKHKIKSKEKQKLEEQLASSKELIQFIFSILYMERPKIFAVLYIFLSSALWYLYHLQLSTVTLYCLAGFFFIFCFATYEKGKQSRIYLLLMHFSHQQIASSGGISPASKEAFDQVINFIISSKHLFYETKSALSRYRKYNSTKFTMHMCTIFLTLAYFGSIFTGVELVLVLVHIGLFIPSIVVHRVPYKLVEYAKPYLSQIETLIKPHQEKIMKKLGLVKETADQTSTSSNNQQLTDSKKDK